ncbi:MAG: hypothetical protein VZR06_09330, partial [Butyrivibrio sp.]|nr:hypothetical protein [Butyrivibrio sp.]
PKKNNTIWWVLGWLFFFPAPVMVLIWRKKNTWDVKVKAAVTATFWIIIFIMGSVNDTESVKNSVYDESQNIEEPSQVQSNSTRDSSNNTNEQIVPDEIVNNYLIAYNSISKSPLADISKSTIRTKFFAYSYGYYLELLHSNETDKITITITETNDNADIGVNGMRDVFHDSATVIDSSLSDDEIYTFFDSMVSERYMSTNTLGTIEVSYFPDTDLSSGHSRGHISMCEKVFVEQ